MNRVPPIVFDRPLHRERLRRAARAKPASFLLDRAALDLDLRLSAVSRTFGEILDSGSPGADAEACLRARFPQARIVRAAPVEASLGRQERPALVADEEAIPFHPAAFDLVVSLLSLQWANDLPGVLAQIRGVLKPDGLFLGCLIAGQTLTELRSAFALAEEETTGGASPRVAPFVDVRDMGALLQRAGFALPVSDLETIRVRYGDAFGLMRDLRAMGAANCLVERSRRPLRRSTLMRAAQIYGERFCDPDGRVRATFDLVWLSGWAPHESQQRPLRPGSARMRLADALGVAEGDPQR
ncbi:MAG TPA: methyltransferase domain-containing protein [Beijerinckiaceae bacterium]|nr:methyltransferase domain-containing protein [Beijerinckiaceae bacterium]